jgi:hypothetical protein
MKKLYMLVGAALFSTAMFGQSTFSDDFESYNVGDYIGAVSPNWTTWDGITGGTEDTQVENTMNNTPSGSKSCHWTSSSSTGGPQDCILPFGGAYTTGTFTYQMDMFVDANKGAYFNFQGQSTLGNSFPMECYLRQTGAFTCSNTDGTLLTGTYPTNAWFTLRYDINLNTNTWNMFINNVSVGSFANSKDSISAIDIFAYNGGTGGNNMASFYVDNVSYAYTAYTLPVLNAAVTNIGNISVGVVGATKYPVIRVRNLGTSTLTSFDLAVNYNSNTTNQSFTSQSIPSLGVMDYTMTAPITMAAGNLPVTVTISNVNGNVSDNDPSDDVKILNLNPAVPAPNKVVVVEEATGTWCPWCVRGTVFMDYMSNTYGALYAGIAVHNADPMTVAPYDSAMATHVTGYPSVLVDRQAAIDPSGVEQPFLTRVAVAPVAALVNGAVLNGNILKVSVTYTFATATVGTNYKYACVLTEDGLTGVGSQWSQNNAYAGGANGVMGGYELLPNPVSYTQMHYDHVARAISPGWAGSTGFPSAIAAGQSVTWDFTFTVPSTWTLNNMHIIGMLIQANNQMNNASYSTVTQALGNGFVDGIFAPGATALEGPDNVNLFPNPTNGTAFANVQLDKSENVSIRIMDVSGKVVAERSYGEMTGTNLLPIETTSYAKGIYFVQVTTGTTVTTTKLIVQ